MKRILSWVSGVSLICAIASGLLYLGHSAGSHRRSAYFISLPGGMLLCVDAILGPGWRTFACSTVDGSLKAGVAPPIKPSSERTLPLSSVVY